MMMRVMRNFCLLFLLFPLLARAADPAEALKKSVHRDLDCGSCHAGSFSPGDPKSSINKKNIPSTCGTCHGAIAGEYVESVHGIAVAKGNVDAQVCTDCHGDHSILPSLEKLSRVYPTNIAKTTCPQCHASERIITKYNLPSGKVESFKDTYHGMAGKIGDVKAANCASCHGVHNILPSNDPRSTINAANLAATCRKCHPNAGVNFAKGSVHGYPPDHISGRLIRFVTWFYVGLILFVIGGDLLHNGLDYLKKVRAIYQKRLKEPYYRRMTMNERVQHALLLISFTTLVVTGFALKFGWTIPLVGDLANTLLRSTLHRVAGVVMILLLFYHLFYVMVSRRGREILKFVFPKPVDVKQAFQYCEYLVGLRKEKPAFGFFTYWEKMEYWSVLWGCLIMGVTGLLLWFENWSLHFIPKWGFDLVTLVHYLEAILATLAILFGHLYFVVANPDVAPISFTWITGRIPEEYAREEHPAAYQEKK